jgi:uncharacterized phage protein (TIGR01671 family)
MNRQLKFRAWRENKMHFNITKAHYEHNAMSGSGGDLWDFAEWLKWSKVMQYTGLKDKNGVEIYEGDIVKATSDQYENENFVGKVIFDEGCFLTWINKNDIRGIWGEDDIEVVGNIFENPELLK